VLEVRLKVGSPKQQVVWVIDKKAEAASQKFAVLEK
jgi:hypothetical protein